VQNSVPVVGFATVEGEERPTLPFQPLEIRLSLRRTWHTRCNRAFRATSRFKQNEKWMTETVPREGTRRVCNRLIWRGSARASWQNRKNVGMVVFTSSHACPSDPNVETLMRRPRRKFDINTQYISFRKLIYAGRSPSWPPAFSRRD